MQGHSQPRLERREYAIQLPLTEESRQVLIFFAKLNAKLGVRKFLADSYSISDLCSQVNLEDSQKGILKILNEYTHIILPAKFVIRRLNAPNPKEVFPDDFAIDVYSGKKISLPIGDSCELEHVMGSLLFPAHESPRFDEKSFYVLEPGRLTDGTSELLASILTAHFNTHKVQSIISPNDLFDFSSLNLGPIEGHQGKLLIQIAETLIRQPCSHVPESCNHTPENHFEIRHEDVHYFLYTMDRIGSGTFSGIDKIAGKLTYQNGRMRFQVIRDWVGKLQSVTRSTQEFVLNEYRMTDLAGTPAVKRPMFFAQSTSVILMKLIKGKDLQHISALDREEMREDKNSRDFNHRIRMIILAIRRYLKQIQANGIKHRDLKNTNVKFGQQVTFLDFGLSCLINENETLAGTPGFAAPEFFDEKPLTTKSDVFSFCWMIVEILRGQSESKDFEEAKKKSKSLNEEELRKFGLFKGMENEINVELRDEIIRLIASGFSVQPEKRPTFEVLLAKFEKIMFERMYPASKKSQSNAKNNANQPLKNAHEKGALLRRTLYDFSQTHTEISEKICDDLSDIIQNALKEIDNKTPAALTEFLDIADLGMFEATDKLVVIHQMSTMLITLKENLGVLKQIQKKINDKYALITSELSEAKKKACGNPLLEEKYKQLNSENAHLIVLTNWIEKLLEKTKRRPTFELVVELNKKYKTAIPKILKSIDSLNRDAVPEDTRHVTYDPGVIKRAPSPGALSITEAYQETIKAPLVEEQPSEPKTLVTTSSQADAAASHRHTIASKKKPELRNSDEFVRENYVLSAGLLFAASAQKSTDTLAPGDGCVLQAP